MRRSYAERRRFAEQQDAGVPLPAPTQSTFDVSADERTRIYEAGWQRGGVDALLNAFTDIFTSAEANETAAAFARQKIRDIVRDPAVAEALSPTAHIGTKRTCVDMGYYETYNRDNVELVDLRRERIERLTDRGIRTSGREYELDCIVFAIGFDAITGALLGIDIRGVEGRTLREHWVDGPRSYLGLSGAGFPNMFMVTGPGSPSVLTNMVVSIEQHVDWIAQCLETPTAAVCSGSTPRPRPSRGGSITWPSVADGTLFPVANSWFVGANIAGKPRTFMPYVGGCGPTAASATRSPPAATRGSSCRSGDGPAAVDDQRLAGDEARHRRGEPHEGVGDLLHRSEARHRDPRQELLRGHIALTRDVVKHRGVDLPGAHELTRMPPRRARVREPGRSRRRRILPRSRPRSRAGRGRRPPTR